MRVEIHEDAEQDLIKAYRFYEEQQDDLGEYFLNSLFSDIDSLEFYAGIHPKTFGYHRMLADRFPFAVYYRIEDDVARIYAVLDCRKNPNSIRERLT